MYAEDNNGVLPALGNFNPGADGATANLYYWKTGLAVGKNLNEILQPYTPGMLSWVCPATSSPPPDHVDSNGSNAKNTRSSSYFSFHYLPARVYPNFSHVVDEEGEEDNAGKPIPAELANAKAGQVLMQDPIRYDVSTGRGWNANHGSGGYETYLNDANGVNPSGATYYGVSENSELGGNIGLYDGSVNWYTRDRLMNLGQDKRTHTTDFYSILP